MDTIDGKAAAHIKDVCRQIGETAIPCNGGDSYVYAKVACIAFDEMKGLREKGIRFEVICRELEREGCLPQGANPGSLSRAFRREAARRSEVQKTNSSHKEEKNWLKPSKPSVSTDGSKAETFDAEAEREKRKKQGLGGRVVHTGTGKIIKTPDGGFEF